MRRFALVALIGLCAETAHARLEPSYDARPARAAAGRAEPRASQAAALAALRAELGALYAPLDARTGATQRLGLLRGGYLTPPRPGTPPVTVALEFIAAHREALGLQPGDLDELVLEKSVVSPLSGATHLYWMQHHRGIPVDKGRIRAAVSRDGRLLSVSNGAMPAIAAATGSAVPALDAGGAIAAAARHLGVQQSSAPSTKASLVWLPIEPGVARLAWKFRVDVPKPQHRYMAWVDAESGQVWRHQDLVAGATYKVFPHPVESPYHTAAGPLADGRSLAVDPEDDDASPYGWQALDETTTFDTLKGNNVHVYQDHDNNDLPPAVEPTCLPSEVCGEAFALDLSEEAPNAPYSSVDAAIANAFYWTNLVHDVSYTYGFDEAAGNFQEVNHSGQGQGGDAFRVLVQDYAYSYVSPPILFNNVMFDPIAGAQINGGGGVDGVAPAIYVLVFDKPGVPFPSNLLRDAALDNMVMVHEYAHGITRRIVDPSDDTCFGGAKQVAEEGLSDFFGLWYTTGASHSGADERPFGFYAGFPQVGTPRTKPYSTSNTINPLTFADTSALPGPYADGVVIGQALWETYWKLRNYYGFSATPHDTIPRKGNHRIMAYLTEGLRMLTCNDPDFLEIRQSLLDAAVSLNAAHDRCHIWHGFANVGMGALAGYDGNGNAVDSFAIPSGACGDGCGLGFELAPVLAALWALRRRIAARPPRT